MRRRVAATLLIAVVACGGSDEPIAEGVVVDVEGTLTTVERFTIRTTDGEDLTFVPGPDVGFHGRRPLGHLRVHLTSGEPVVIAYEKAPDGSLVALEIEDG